MDELAEPTLEESLAQLILKAPKPVQTFVFNELAKTTSGLMDRYNLHIDQGGLLESELLLLLVGQSKPAEFVENLKKGGIAEPVVQSITADVNKEVFMRLRDEERKEDATPPPAPTPPRQQIVLPPPPLPKPAAALPPHAHSDSELPVVRTTSTPPPQQPVAVPPPAPPKVSPSVVSTPPSYITDALSELEHTEEVTVPKGKDSINQLSTPEVSPATSIKQAHVGHVTHTMAADMALVREGKDPAIIAHPEQKAVVPPPLPESRPAPPTPPRPTTPPVSSGVSYSTDPYREPIE